MKVCYRIQIRRGVRRHWETRFSSDNHAEAHLLYEGINIGYGWQKRLTRNNEEIRRSES
jgi:hypothetical protein